jgi:hypothetical protein
MSDSERSGQWPDADSNADYIGLRIRIRNKTDSDRIQIKNNPSIPVYDAITYFEKKLNNYFGQQNIRSMLPKLYR